MLQEVEDVGVVGEEEGVVEEAEAVVREMEEEAAGGVAEEAVVEGNLVVEGV